MDGSFGSAVGDAISRAFAFLGCLCVLLGAAAVTFFVLWLTK